MKKFFKKNDLFKLAGLFALIVLVASWIVPQGIYESGTIYSGTGGTLSWKYDLATRGTIGFFDWSTYTLAGFNIFTATFIFILIVAGFYKLLNNMYVYQVFTDKLANKIKGKGNIFIAVSAFLIAAFAGVATDPLVSLMFIPFIMTVLSKAKFSKTTALLTTFGAVLVGQFGATYSSKIAGSLANATYGLGSAGITIGYELAATIVLFAIAYLLLTYFAMKLKHTGAIAIDIFESKVTKPKKAVKVNTLPLVVILTLFAIITVLAFIPWESAFNITIFKDFADDILSFNKFFDTNIFSYLLGGEFKTFGNMDLYNLCGYIFMMIILLKIAYHVSVDKIIESFGEGFKAIGKTLVLVIVIYTVLEFTVGYEVLPAVLDAIFGFGTNAVTLFINGALTQLFAVDFQYAVSIIGSVYAKYSDAHAAALILQSSAGLISFVAPTSVMLMFGLSMQDMRFSEYIKSVWKFLLALAAVTIIVLIILMTV